MLKNAVFSLIDTYFWSAILQLFNLLSKFLRIKVYKIRLIYLDKSMPTLRSIHGLN